MSKVPWIVRIALSDTESTAVRYATKEGARSSIADWVEQFPNASIYMRHEDQIGETVLIDRDQRIASQISKIINGNGASSRPNRCPIHNGPLTADGGCDFCEFEEQTVKQQQGGQEK